MDGPGEKFLIKLWETLADKGVGGFLTPWHEKRVAKARTDIRRNEMLAIAQAEMEVEQIRAGKAVFDPESGLKLLNAPNAKSAVDSLGRIEPVLDLSGFARRSAELDISDSLRKEVNIAKAIHIAEDTLSQESGIPPEDSVDEDWLYSWREYAGRISSSELQDLWGRVLAGEVKQPGRFSLRTLDFVKGLSKREAELISKVAPFVIVGRIVRDYREILEQNGVSMSLLTELQELGIVSGVGSIGMTITVSSSISEKFDTNLIAHNKVLLVSHDDPSRELKLNVYGVTNLGREVLELASFGVNEEYLELVAQGIIKKGFKVKLADWEDLSSNSGRYFNERELF